MSVRDTGMVTANLGAGGRSSGSSLNTQHVDASLFQYDKAERSSVKFVSHPPLPVFYDGRRNRSTIGSSRTLCLVPSGGGRHVLAHFRGTEYPMDSGVFWSGPVECTPYVLYAHFQDGDADTGIYIYLKRSGGFNVYHDGHSFAHVDTIEEAKSKAFDLFVIVGLESSTRQVMVKKMGGR